jgi:thiol-disulfide isomerase/thioredoxin
VDDRRQWLLEIAATAILFALVWALLWLFPPPARGGEPDAAAAVAIALAKVQADPPPSPPPAVCAYLWTASWCPPCRTLHALVDQLYAEGYDVQCLDADKFDRQYRDWQIRALPTIVIVRGDESGSHEIARRVGARWSIDELRKWFVDSHVAKGKAR